VIDEKGKFDELIEDKGVKILIDPKALMHVIGTKMDFVDDKLRYTHFFMFFFFSLSLFFFSFFFSGLWGGVRGVFIKIMHFDYVIGMHGHISSFCLLSVMECIWIRITIPHEAK
jgi:hypothetical protein